MAEIELRDFKAVSLTILSYLNVMGGALKQPAEAGSSSVVDPSPTSSRAESALTGKRTNFGLPPFKRHFISHV